MPIRLLVILCAGVLAGCGSVASAPVGASLPLMLAERTSAFLQSDAGHAAQNVYVATYQDGPAKADGGLSVYRKNSGQLTAHVTFTKMWPRAIALSPAGQVYIAVASSVFVYNPSGTSLLRRIDGFSDIGDIGFDHRGNLYVADTGANAVRAFAPDAVTAAWSVATNAPAMLAVDDDNTLYVLNEHTSVSVFRFGTTAAAYVVEAGLTSPQSLAVTRSGRLFVYNEVVGAPTISVFAPNTTAPAYKISRGVGFVTRLAVDAVGDLAVANNGALGAPGVTVYTTGSATPSYALPCLRRDIPQDVTFDAANNLYVGYYISPVQIYTMGSSMFSYLVDAPRAVGIAVDP